MKQSLKGVTLAAALSVLAWSLPVWSLPAAAQQDQQQKPKQSVPDAPTPQAAAPLPGTQGPVTPGKGEDLGLAPGNSSSTNGQPATQPAPEQPASDQPPAPAPPPSSAAPSNAAPSSQLPSAEEQQTPPDTGAGALQRYVIEVNFVEVPVLVKDTKGNAVAGLTWRDFKVYENNTLEPLSLFSVDPEPLSIAFVVDQTLPSPVMEKVNDSLGSIQGALTPYDEAALFTYTNGAKEWTGFTGGQSARLPAVLALAQATGTDPQVPINSGPLGSPCAVIVNGGCSDPNVQYGGDTADTNFMKLPKEIHTLNDAILAAAKQLSTRPKDRRRIIYVISDGKEYGSKASWKEVVRYLQTNKIAVDGTLVGDSARWGEGWVDRFHLPFQMYDNILLKYTQATGGELNAEGGLNGIEKSYAKIAAEARNEYTLGYLTHESIYDGKYRSIDVRVDRQNLVVTAKGGYYPSAQDYR